MPTPPRSNCGTTTPRSCAQRARRRGRARGVRRRRAGAGRGARRAGMAGMRANLDQRGRDADAHRSDHPRAQPRRGAARHRARADGARAADRRGAAAGDAAKGMELVRDWIEEKAGADLDALALALDDQRAFAGLATKCSATSSWSRARTVRRAARRGRGRRAATSRTRAPTPTEDERRRGRRRRGRSRDARRGRRERRRGRRLFGRRVGEGDDGLGEEGEEGMLPVRPNRPLADLPPAFDYRVYTSRFDEVGRGRPNCATRRSSAGCAPISTSSSSICRARSPSSPTGSSAG